ncbi:HsdR family type I site-specific deoxyribonuclease [Bernardetia sp. ABR2-2B]|uniref:type I restriction endonuclease subunit R n=1 Tax=Bernardetia sp. ABR2-2B TaxID=3127472 RepID=UPI0030D42A93
MSKRTVSPEREVQNRVLKVFQNELDYRYIGDLSKEDNHNLRRNDIEAFLKKQNYTPVLIQKALYELEKAVSISAQDSLYVVNKEVYSLLRYGVSVKESAGEQYQTVYFIDWKNIYQNDFAVAEEVSTKGANHTRRPDIVLYINGIAIGVLELKKSSVSVSQGIRQNISCQEHLFVKPFFTTVQLVMAGNDSGGLYYGTTGTSEKFFLKWKEEESSYQPDSFPLDKEIKELLNKERVMDILYNFIIFDFGTKKLCRPNQYFGVKAAQKSLSNKEGGIIWHTQGSGKSLTMVWLAKWVLENKPLGDSQRVLIVTDRTELDDQIEGVFSGVGETIARSKSSADLLTQLNDVGNRLMCTLVHKFGERTTDNDELKAFLKDLARPKNFSPKGEFVVFIDECHRTQSGSLHDAMKALLPEGSRILIGFTGTPLLKKDKKTSLEKFGSYIHTYKFNDAVKDNVVLDLLYEARDVDQHIVDQTGIDDWFDAHTEGMNDLPKAQLKQQWGTMQKLLSSKSRLERIVADIKMDFAKKPRLKAKRGNAILVARSIYEACRYYKIFTDYGFKRCAVVSSFEPNAQSTKQEETGDGTTEKKEQYEIYQKMLKDYNFETTQADKFEDFAKKQFKENPSQMQLLIVVDKLLTGFDAIHCTYLYIDKKMQDHGLFQAICRTNRLGNEEEEDEYYKDFGYIVDYQSLFGKLEDSISTYTSDAFDSFDEADIKDLLSSRQEKNKERLDDAIETLHHLCEPVAPPKELPQYYNYFCGDPSKPEDLKEREQKRLTFYKAVVSLIRSYNNIASEILQSYSKEEADKIKKLVNEYTELRNSIKEYSGDYIDLKKYEPEMRQLLDMYLTADPSRMLSNLGEKSLLQLIIENGIEDATEHLSPQIKKSKESISEAVENNIRKIIIQEMPINPIFYGKMSELLGDLIEQRKTNAISYEELLKKYEELAKDMQPDGKKQDYPADINTPAKRALYDNLEKNEAIALALNESILLNKYDNWIGHFNKERNLKIQVVLPILVEHKSEDKLESIFEIIKQQAEYK